MWEKQEEKRLSAKFLACADAISAVSIVNLQFRLIFFLQRFLSRTDYTDNTDFLPRESQNWILRLRFYGNQLESTTKKAETLCATSLTYYQLFT